MWCHAPLCADRRWAHVQGIALDGGCGAGFSRRGRCCGTAARRCELRRAARPVIALRHVEIIDGTRRRAAQRSDTDHRRRQDRGRRSRGQHQRAQRCAAARCSRGRGAPRVVGMHDHLFYTASRDTQRNSPGGIEPGFVVNEIAYSAPRLYLAAGVTTLAHDRQHRALRRSQGARAHRIRCHAGAAPRSDRAVPRGPRHLLRADARARRSPRRRRGSSTTGPLPA